jgi:hypothetical protein
MAQRYVDNALYTVQSLRRELVLQLEALSPVSQDDLDAYNRAVQAWRDQQVLWEHEDGLLDAGHDRVRTWSE